jgi:predicted transcriptional regulator of viral defense system
MYIVLSCTYMTQISPVVRVNRLSQLLRSDRKLFHTQDLALLWSVENRNTLYTVIKRYLRKGVLIKITKGLYSTLPPGEIDKFKLGSSLIHKFCYVSCETVLEKEGLINQKIYPITFVSSVSQKIEFMGREYIYRKLKPEILLDPEGVEKKDGYFMATRERAVRDMLYFNPRYYFDSQ